jgi:threonine dehydrogenase-like Zn-dependent dehydrogenase
MQAAVLGERGLRLDRRKDPVPGRGEALIRTLLAGICGTDLELLRGYRGFRGVPGHEFVGVVESAPEDPAWEGRRVTADINVGCGRCPRCLSSDPRHCPQREVVGLMGRDGAFAEYLTIPTRNLHEVPQGIADEVAVFAEPLAAALEPGQQLHLRNGTRLGVLGDGKLGLLAALGLRLHCPGLLLIGRHRNKLRIAEEQGVRTELETPPRGAEEEAGRGRFDVVVEATGRPEGFGRALELVRPEGAVVVKTTVRGPSAVDLSRITVSEVQVIGSRCGDLDLALAVLENGWVRVEPILEAIYPFGDFERAMQHAGRTGSRKVLLDFRR